jgi:hypothetical protein
MLLSYVRPLGQDQKRHDDAVSFFQLFINNIQHGINQLEILDFGGYAYIAVPFLQSLPF